MTEEQVERYKKIAEDAFWNYRDVLKGWGAAKDVIFEAHVGTIPYPPLTTAPALKLTYKIVQVPTFEEYGMGINVNLRDVEEDVLPELIAKSAHNLAAHSIVTSAVVACKELGYEVTRPEKVA